jgi:hypothetical protein
MTSLMWLLQLLPCTQGTDPDIPEPIRVNVYSTRTMLKNPNLNLNLNFEIEFALPKWLERP